VERRFAAGDLHDVRLLLIAHHAVEHGFYLREGAEFGAVLPASRIADGACQVAGITDLDEGETTVLLVIGAQSAVIGTAVLDGRVVDHGLLGNLDEDFPGAAVIVDVVGDQHALMAMLRTAFEHPDLAVFKHDLRVDAAVAGGADGDSDVVEEVGAELIGHGPACGGWVLRSLRIVNEPGSLSGSSASSGGCSDGPRDEGKDQAQQREQHYPQFDEAKRDREISAKGAANRRQATGAQCDAERYGQHDDNFGEIDAIKQLRHEQSAF